MLQHLGDFQATRNFYLTPTIFFHFLITFYIKCSFQCKIYHVQWTFPYSSYSSLPHHYWKHVLCRGPNLGHSAKTLFTKGPPQRPSAKKDPRHLALGTDALNKLGLLGYGDRDPSTFTEGQPLGPRQSFFWPSSLAKVFYFFYSLPRAIAQALDKEPLCLKKCYPCYLVYLESLCMNSLQISHIFFA